MMPATRATRPATDQTTTQIVLSGMPMESAASWSSATARSARPTRVRWKNTARTATSTAAVIAAVSSSRLTCTPHAMNEVSGMPTSSFLTLLPQTSSPKPSRKKLSPIVAMNRMICSWFTSGRSTTRSMAKASATITTMVRTSAATSGRPALHQPHQGQRREEHHHALGEVEHAGGLVDEHEAQRHQRVHEPGGEAADQHLDQEAGRARHVLEGRDQHRVDAGQAWATPR